MALSPEEKQILEYGKANGKGPTEVKAAIAKFRSQQQPATATASTMPEKKPLGTAIADTVFGAGQKAANFLGLGKATDVIGRDFATTRVGAALMGQDYETNKQYIEAPSLKEKVGAVLQPAGLIAGTAISGGSSLLGQVAAGAGAGYLYDVGQDLVEDKSAA
jgi:hypothetical protein